MTTPAPEAKPAAKPKPAAKRKKAAEEDEESEPEPKTKRARTAEAIEEESGSELEEPKPKKARATKALKTVKEAKNLAKGPTRRGGKKVEINALRYTEPLKVFVFGEGGSGELGLGATSKAIDVKRPRFNEALSNQDVVRIATGGMHVVALTKDNRILTWGVNDNGALGRDTSNVEVKMKDIDDAGSDSDSDDDPTGGLNPMEATPTAISSEHFPDDTVFVDVVAGDSCSFALTTEGAVYGWGTFRKNEGVLGFTRFVNTARTPIYIDTVKKIVDIACGTNHVLCVDKDHRVWAWGNGQQNQLGRRVTERNLIEALIPNRVGFHDTSVKRPSQKMVQVACGDYHSMAIGEDGHVWAWGANNYAETGYPNNAGDNDASVPAPKVILSLEDHEVLSLACGSHHNVAVTKTGQLLTWGRCDSAQTGIAPEQLNSIDDEDKVLKGENGRAKILIEPTPIPGMSDIVMATCGPDHTIAINSQGHAYAWGFSANYQTGLGTDDDVVEPLRIENTAVKDTKLTWAGAGGQYSIVASLKKDSA